MFRLARAARGQRLEELRGPRDEDISAVIVRLFGEHAANEQIVELVRSEQDEVIRIAITPAAFEAIAE